MFCFYLIFRPTYDGSLQFLMAGSSDFLDCVICNESLFDPRALPCGHSYCGPPRPCLKAMEVSCGGLCCAICRMEHNLRSEDIKPLYGIRDFFQRSENVSQLPCSIHFAKNYSLWCNNCQVMICDECFDDHDGPVVRKLKKYLVEKIESKLGKPLIEGLVE